MEFKTYSEEQWADLIPVHNNFLTPVHFLLICYISTIVVYNPKNKLPWLNKQYL